ncbi:hypothetical protein K435DRAFT_968557 [Dendrothele bispora CBS 962.96]|uniref:Uncharacterized protein n=1 Tax=Dendrothele bispora (strain CBS 962.96) TaxID=1314807 RepID=A0A4S8LNL4_DENBC|nr:hypothetical protein K435DRAFT_968557 [Dendrothele bispora CBS 962.96]
MSRRPGGLPTGPSPRSHSRPRREEHNRSDREQSSSRPLRSQKSASSLPRSRITEPRRAPRALPNDYESRHRRSDDSTSSLSSGASSLFDRVRNGAASYASSFTSIEGDEEDDKNISLRNRRLARSSSPQDVPDSTGTGDGYTIWSRVASAASTLTVSVSKAWTTNITTFAGEETPPGQESRLTRAMKAYHLEKARDPSDLPAWLFEEHERRPLQQAHRPERSRRDVEERDLVASVAEPPRPRGLRDIYDSVSRPEQQPIPSGLPVGKGTDRLKALREAKRTVALDQRTGSRTEPTPEGRQRVGLPSGPSRRR